MVDDISARRIANTVQNLMGMGVSIRIVRRQDLLFPKDSNEKAMWDDSSVVPPSYFDFRNLYLVEPSKNWPEYGQVDADNGKPGISKRFCFFLTAREMGHRIYAPASLFQKIQEVAILNQVEDGWGLYQRYLDAMIVDTVNMTSKFMQETFKDYEGVIVDTVKQLNGKKIAEYFSAGEEIVLWEECVTRILVAVAESVSPGKSPTQSKETGSVGILSTDLKKTERGKYQMEKLNDMYHAVLGCAKNAASDDMGEFLRYYRIMGTTLHDILGDYAKYITTPIPADLSDELLDITGTGPFKHSAQALDLLDSIAVARDALHEAYKNEKGGTR
jgi:hypothetical protein